MVRGQREGGRGHLISASRRVGVGMVAGLLVVLGAGVLEGGAPAFALTTTTTTLQSSLNPSTFGQSVTFTATVTGTSPTGTVAFSGGGISGCAAQPLDGSGMATCVTAALPVESNQTVTATYSGDGTNDTSFGTVSQTVTKVNTTTAVLSSVNPSTVGQSVTFTATVSGGSSPTGTVAFSGTGITGCDAQPLTSGMATCATTTLPVGTNETVTATYGGDGNNATSFGTVNQTVTSVTSGTALMSSLNPSHFGQSVTFTATVTGSSPTGTVAFTGGGISTCGVQALTAGMATCTTAALGVGSGQTITATYSGDGNNATSFKTLSQTVTAATSGTVIMSSQNPSTFGQSVTFTATVTGTSPTGTVAFTGGGISTCATQALTAGHGDLHHRGPRRGRRSAHHGHVQRRWQQRDQQ